jgi:hypothetical protein
MESINVVVDDEEAGALSKGENPLPTDTPVESSSPITRTVKSPSPPKDKLIIPANTPPQESESS